MKNGPGGDASWPRRLVFWSAISAALLWLIAWAHLLLAHGVTTENERNVVFGFTWLDSSRLVVFALVAAAVATVGLLRGAAGTSAGIATVLSTIAFVVCSVGVVLGFWSQPWRTYVGASRETGVAAIGGGLVAVGTLLLAIGLVMAGVVLVRRSVVPRWLGVVVGVGALSTFPWLHETTVQGPLFGLSWVAVAVFAGRARG